MRNYLDKVNQKLTLIILCRAIILFQTTDIIQEGIFPKCNFQGWIGEPITSGNQSYQYINCVFEKMSLHVVILG